MKKRYSAIIFRQRDGSPLQVAFTAPSSEIDAWARVPTKRTGNVRHFQRAENARHSQEISQFFEDEGNSSPTAVVVGFDPIRAEGRVRTLDAGGEPLLEETIKGGMQSLGHIEIDWPDPEDAVNPAEQLQRISAAMPLVRGFIGKELEEITGIDTAKAAMIEDHLAKRQEAGFEVDSEGEESSADDGAPDDGSLNDSSDVLDENLGDDAPESVTKALAGLSPADRQIVTGRLGFLASLRPEVLSGKPHATVSELLKMVADELKPGILIDGQHRVSGTRKLGHIPFLVTALPSAQWPELAFQFIVTNRTAKKVPESLLISIIGNSLSKAQRAEIEERLREAGIRVGLIEAVMRVHEDEQSPFHALISFGIRGEQGFLDAAAMRGKVIRPWYERQGPIEYLFDHFCEGKRKSDRTDYWKSEEIWFELFASFWSAVKQRYEGSTVFSTELVDSGGKRLPASRLMTATVLMIFQDTVLRYLKETFIGIENATNKPVGTQITGAAEFAEMVVSTLQRLNPEFFTGWQLSGFDGSRGARDDLSDAIKQVISKEKTVAQLKDQKRPHRLFKEQA